MYDKDNDACSDFQIYRRLKNKVAWEAGGMFSAYLSCDLSASSIKSAEPESMTMRRQGKVALLVCRYGDNIELGVALSEPRKKAKSAHLTTRNSVRDRPFTGTTSPFAYCAT
jgi:hypothetical protein